MDETVLDEIVVDEIVCCFGRKCFWMKVFLDEFYFAKWMKVYLTPEIFPWTELFCRRRGGGRRPPIPAGWPVRQGEVVLGCEVAGRSSDEALSFLREKVGPKGVGGPKFRSFFSLSRRRFHSFFSLGSLLVEFWCF